MLEKVSNSSKEDARRDAVKLLFTDVMNCPEDVVKTLVRSLIDRVSPSTEEPSSKQPRSTEEQEHRRLSKVMVQLDADYPGDNGVIMPLLLNYLELSPGMQTYTQVIEIDFVAFLIVIFRRGILHGPE